MHIFIDTNILLDFYHFSKDQLDVLERVLDASVVGVSRVYLTQQVCDEFARNRERKIIDATKQFKESKLSPQLPSFMRHYPEHQEIRELADKLKKLSGAINDRARSDIATRTLPADRVIQRFVAKLTPIVASTDLVREATTRSRIGNPPGKPGSIGDAINWTLLIQSIPDGEDLHVISKDGDFFSSLREDAPMDFLADEWKREKSGKLFVYRSLGSFMNAQSKHFDGIEQLLLGDELYELGTSMADSDETICGLIAESNAAGYSCDEAEVTRVSRVDDNTIEFEAYIQLTADEQRKDDVPWWGDQIRAEVSGHYVRDEDGRWSILDYTVEGAELNTDQFGPEDDDVHFDESDF